MWLRSARFALAETCSWLQLCCVLRCSSTHASSNARLWLQPCIVFVCFNRVRIGEAKQSGANPQQTNERARSVARCGAALRLRSTFAELGEEIYERMIGGSNGSVAADDTLNSFRTRIEGLKEELKRHAEELDQVMHPNHGQVAAEAAEESETQTP